MKESVLMTTVAVAVLAIDEAYRLGSQPYLNVLDAQRTLADIQLRWIEAQVRGAAITSGIESITGRPINAARR
jgi:outer membrane protein TolC